MQDHHGVGDAAPRVAPGLTQGGVVHPQLGQDLAGLEPEVPHGEVALPMGGNGGRRAGGGGARGEGARREGAGRSERRGGRLSLGRLAEAQEQGGGEDQARKGTGHG